MSKISYIGMAIIATAAIVSGICCDKATEADIQSHEKPHTIYLYAGSADPVRTFHTDSNVQRTDGGVFYFMDKSNGKLVQVTGNVVVTQD